VYQQEDRALTKVLSGAAIALALAAAFPGVAQAQCWWNGYAWSCGSQSGGGYYAPYWGYESGYGLGYAPRGLPHSNGPEPGGSFYHMGQSMVGHTD
jgi:hypothetical protein